MPGTNKRSQQLPVRVRSTAAAAAGTVPGRKWRRVHYCTSITASEVVYNVQNRVLVRIRYVLYMPDVRCERYNGSSRLFLPIAGCSTYALPYKYTWMAGSSSHARATCGIHFRTMQDNTNG
eukprot:scaffold148709_cov19-Prasinocladus_malaysianus.AAC.1